MADRSLVLERKVDGGATHVLLLGIGTYPWLEGGAKCTTPAQRAAAMGLGQLGAPPLSMRAMADWFIDSFDNPEKPLASLSLLLSEDTPAVYRGKEVPSGTIAEVEDAVAAWIDRSNARRDNALVFGFCGHGMLSGQNSVLLCRDFGAKRQNPFAGAIDFEQFRIALSTRLPDTQLLLVDACRTRDLDVDPQGASTPGNRLLGVVSTAPRDGTTATQSIQYATSPLTLAWGPDDGPSLFTQALLDSLAGGAADRTDDWWVTTTELQGALATYLARLSRTWAVQQIPGTQMQPFRICKPRDIAVPLYVCSSDPTIWKERVKIGAARGTSFSETIEHDPAEAPERCECVFKLRNPSQKPRDVIYDVLASFDAGSAFADADDQIIAYPPEVVCTLQVRRRT